MTGPALPPVPQALIHLTVLLEAHNRQQYHNHRQHLEAVDGRRKRGGRTGRNRTNKLANLMADAYKRAGFWAQTRQRILDLIYN